MRVTFARNLAFFDESERKAVLGLLWQTREWKKHRTVAKIYFFLALFGENDSSWKDNSKLRIELLFLTMFNFDFMAYDVDLKCWIAL